MTTAKTPVYTKYIRIDANYKVGITKLEFSKLEGTDSYTFNVLRLSPGTNPGAFIGLNGQVPSSPPLTVSGAARTTASVYITASMLSSWAAVTGKWPVELYFVTLHRGNANSNIRSID